jgi:CHAD domain-containing protein
VEIKKALHQNCQEETSEFLRGKSVATVDRLLRKINRRARNLKVKAEGWTAIYSGLRESYSRGRKAFELAREETSPDNFHHWRKHVQDIWHQLRLLRPIRPANLHAAIGKLKTLSQQLGDDHDLVMLRQFATRHCARRCPREVKLLKELIELRQKELRSDALALGARFYAEKPSRFCRRIESYWHAWRTGKKSGN